MNLLSFDVAGKCDHLSAAWAFGFNGIWLLVCAWIRMDLMDLTGHLDKLDSGLDLINGYEHWIMSYGFGIKFGN